MIKYSMVSLKIITYSGGLPLLYILILINNHIQHLNTFDFITLNKKLKNAWGGDKQTNRQTDRQTDIATTRPTQPRGPSW